MRRAPPSRAWFCGLRNERPRSRARCLARFAVPWYVWSAARAHAVSREPRSSLPVFLLSVVPAVAFPAGRWRPRRPATPACPASLPARPEGHPAQMFWPTFCSPRRATARLARPLTNGRRAQRRGGTAASRSGSRLRRWGTSTRARSAPRTTRSRSSTPTRRITRFLVRLPAGPVPVRGRL